MATRKLRRKPHCFQVNRKKTTAHVACKNQKGFCAHATNARQLGPSDDTWRRWGDGRTWNIGARWFRFGAAPILPKLRAFTLGGASLAPVFSNQPWSKLGKELDQVEDHPSAAAFSSSEVRRLVACDKDIDMTPKAGDTGMSRDMVQSIQHAKHASQQIRLVF